MDKEYTFVGNAQTQPLQTQHQQMAHQSSKTAIKIDKLKIMQWNPQGPINKANDLVLFFAEMIYK